MALWNFQMMTVQKPPLFILQVCIFLKVYQFLSNLKTFSFGCFSFYCIIINVSWKLVKICAQGFKNLRRNWAQYIENCIMKNLWWKSVPICLNIIMLYDVWFVKLILKFKLVIWSSWECKMLLKVVTLHQPTIKCTLGKYSL